MTNNLGMGNPAEMLALAEREKANIAYGLILSGSVPTDAMELLAPVLASFIVGLIYTAGDAAWDDRHQFALGVWLTLVAGAAAVVGTPAHHLVLAIAGGGGFLFAALLGTTRNPTTQ